MNVEIDNVSAVKGEKYSYKGNSNMIDDDPNNTTYKNKKNENPFELASNVSKNNSNSINVSNSKSSINSRKSDFSSYGRLSIRMQKKLSRCGYDEEDILIDFSSRHTAYLISIWLIFVIVFLTGFIVHFDTDNNVTASSILWTFSVVLLLFAIIYSYLYYKCAKAKNNAELYKYLRFIPC